MDEVHIRPITADDSGDLWRIRNDEQVRAVSHDSRPIPRDKHDGWFARYQQHSGNHCWVIEVDDTVAGYCRIDDGLVSIAIDQRFAGRGLGKRLLTHAVTSVPHDVWPLRADIQLDNTASIALFEKVGFRRADQDDRYLHLTYHGA